MIVLTLGLDRLTVKFITLVPELPSFCETSLMESDTGSSSMIVPMPGVLAIVTPVGVGAVRLTLNVSLPSFRVSPLTVTGTVLLVWPGVKVSTVAGIAT